MILEYNGKSMNTADEFELISDEEHQKFIEGWYKLPEKSQVITEMHKLKDGATGIAKITKYYFRALCDMITGI